MTTVRLQQLLVKVENNLPELSDQIVYKQFLEYSAVNGDVLEELIDLGWIVPAKTHAEELLFKSKDVMRVQKLIRLYNDLELSLSGASIIVDLLEKIDCLEKEVARLNKE
ncbi:MAG: chaperone modulator CbpM [Desulfovibrio sp.]